MSESRAKCVTDIGRSRWLVLVCFGRDKVGLVQYIAKRPSRLLKALKTDGLANIYYYYNSTLKALFTLDRIRPVQVELKLAKNTPKHNA